MPNFLHGNVKKKMSLASSLNRPSIFDKLLLLLAFAIPLSQYVSSILLITSCVLTLFITRIQSSAPTVLRNSWDILFYILILLIGLLYSENLTLGLRVLETNLSLIALPLIFSGITDLNEQKSTRVFYAFSLGLSFACLICLLNALFVYYQTGNINSFFFYSLTNIIYLQPTYFAYYIIFAITFGLFTLYYQTTRDYILVKSLSILFLFLVLMLTGGQTAFISILLIFAFFILKFLTEEKGRVKQVAIALIVVMLLAMFITAMLTNVDSASALSDSWDRLVLWESAIDAVPSPFIGVGTGDYKVVLNQYYINHGMVKFASESYNSHNQFIQVLFSNGLLGVFALVLMIARPLYLSFKNDNMLAVLSLFPFLIYGITEVFLGRYQGIVFFAFLHQFFIVQLNSKKPSLLMKPS